MTFPLAGGPQGDVFVGREAELAGLADVLARSRQGEPWLVTIEGESGVGKTALARRALAPSPGLIALWARADPSEADFEYGLIGQLLRGVDRQVLARYPLLAGDVATSSPFAVGVQLLGIIGELQGAGPAWPEPARPVLEIGLARVGPGPQSGQASRGRQRTSGQRRLADTRLALDGDQPGFALPYPGQRVRQPGQFRLPPDEDVPLRPSCQQKGHDPV